ncbi:glycosyltransferase family 4 protein [Chitinophaga filiformis]|uniref:Glycosyltransferase involved in cell wall bisynthesis n=1 Tax=Chitinophaga filiformis TaxID=104663 RepID=A0A1G7NFM1_CHIFI|nr:glycosyltransferase family 1 protein [Chitinophaga filiformis]SDF72766.1 Glycosyltransferase involved in cell wall bisynthesis [Chitinophaga filiformis]
MGKRIAFISEHASPLAALGGADAGGQNVYVGEVARQLAMMDYQIDIFTRREEKKLPKVVPFGDKIRIIHVNAGPAEDIPKETLLQYMPAFKEDMLRFMKEEQITYELIHANFFMSALVAMELKKELGIPFVVTFHALGHIRRIHQGDNDQFPKERITIEENAVKEASMIIAECPQDREDLMTYYKASAEKITVIPCGVNVEELYPVNKSIARSLLGLPYDEKVLLQLGRMVPRKGVDNVIMALAKVKCKHSKVRLLIVGGDVDTAKELTRLKLLAAELRVSDKVYFLGQKSREDLKYYYTAADLFITTPWYEPFGITPLEAMACGTPVIGSKVGGIKYSVADGHSGALVPPKDPDALAHKITTLLQAPALLREMGNNALRRVNKLFTWELVARDMQAVYEGIIGNNDTSSPRNFRAEESISL